MVSDVNMRDGFKDIVDGWMLITGMEDITDRIERAATWTKENGPLLPDEESTVKMMIECQIARGMHGAFGPDDDGDYWDDDDLDELDCALHSDGQCGKAGTEECDFDCPYRDSEFFAGSAAYNLKHGIK